VRREKAVVQGHVRALKHRPEVVERHLVESEKRVESHVRLGEKVGVTVHLAAPGSEDDPLGVNGGGIHAVGRADVADVVGSEEDVRELQGPGRILVDVSEGAVIDLEQVDLERIDGERRLLPSPFVDGNLVVVLLPQLRQVQVDLRLIEREIRNEFQLQELAPLHARLQSRKHRHERVGMRVLPDRHVVESHRETEDVEVEVLDVRGIASQTRVDLLLHCPPHRLVHEERRDDDDQSQNEKDPEELERVLGEVEPGVADLAEKRRVLAVDVLAGSLPRSFAGLRGRGAHGSSGPKKGQSTCQKAPRRWHNLLA
jgi:hypothetical protein